LLDTIILSIPPKDIPAGAAFMPNPLVTALHVYPVKSMKGISLSRATLTARGLLHDRNWMVVAADGRFVTQRNQPRLGLVHTRLEAEGVVLALDGCGSVTLPFDAVAGEHIATQVWNDACDTVDQGSEVSDWLTRAVGSPVQLRIVRMAPGFTRPQNQAERYGADTTTHFADSAPFLLASEDSLGELNRVLAAQGHTPVPMNRFRPNIVIRGLEPFAEHRSEVVAGEDWRIHLTDPCERCIVTTINQETALRDTSREPYVTLRRINPAPGPKPGPAFGQNAILDEGEGRTVAVGDLLSLSS
jgi:uncharacterized protein YcbX